MRKNILKSYFILILSVFFTPCFCPGQQPIIDSLLTLLKNNQPDSVKVNIYNQLSLEYRATPEQDKSVEFAKKALELSKKIHFNKGTSIAYHYLGVMYTNKAKYDSALFFYNQSISIKLLIADTSGVAASYNNIGILYQNKSDFSNAIEFHKKSLELRESISNKKAIAASCNNLGNIYSDISDYDRAIFYYLKSLTILEESGEKKQLATTYNNLGIVYKDKGNIAEAIKYYSKAIELYNEINEAGTLIANTYNNIATAYSIANKKNEALMYFFSALKIFEEMNDQRGIAAALGNIGILYSSKEELDSAVKYHLKCIKINLLNGNVNGEATAHSNIGDVYFKKKDYRLAKEHFLIAIEKAKNIGAMLLLSSSYLSASQCDLFLKNYKSAYFFHELYSASRDSIFNGESSRQIAEMSAKYETGKKDTEIKLLNKDKEIASAESKKQKIVIFSIAGGLVLVLGFAGFIFRSLRTTKKQKHIIEIQKNEVIRQKEIVDEQKRTVEDKNTEISHKNKDLTDSINYAQRIQSAILTSEQYLNEMFPPQGQLASHFILYKPKDIVAGDFYWAYKTLHGKTIWIIADCTGHGVPGAFMSMIGNSLLNEIVVEKGINEPDEILNHLRAGVIKALGQSAANKSNDGLPSPTSANYKSSADKLVKDGMDAAICCWDKSTNKLSFSGANNCLWIVRNSPSASKSLIEDEVKNSPSPLEKELGGEVNSPSLLEKGLGDEVNSPSLSEKGLGGEDNSPSLLERGSGGEVIELTADSQPVGQHIVMKPFTKKEIQLQKGDTLYSFTDGYCDQFGGPKGKKFKYKPFKELLLSIQDRTMPEQREILNITIEEWKKHLEQVDDICVMGVRV